MLRVRNLHKINFWRPAQGSYDNETSRRGGPGREDRYQTCTSVEYEERKKCCYHSIVPVSPTTAENMCPAFLNRSVGRIMERWEPFE
jgi:hypothetical protein